MGDQLNDLISKYYHNFCSLDIHSKITASIFLIVSLVFYLVLVFFIFCLWETFRECVIGLLTIAVFGGGGLAVYDMIDKEKIYLSLIVVWLLLLVQLIAGLFICSAVEDDYFDFEFAIIYMFGGIWSLARSAFLLVLFCTVIGIPAVLLISQDD